MTAELLLETVTARGGQLWSDGGKLKYRLAVEDADLLEAVRQAKPQILELLASRPAIPSGVRLLRWEPKDAPVQLSRCERVTGVYRFIEATLMQVDARLHDKRWLAGNWPLSELIERLAAVGCMVEIENPKVMLQ